MLDGLTMVLSSAVVLGVMLTPLIVPVFGFRWTRRRFGTTAARVFLVALVLICLAIAVKTFIDMREFAEAGAWTAATLAPLHSAFVAFPVLLVATLVWMAGLLAWARLRG